MFFCFQVEDVVYEDVDGAYAMLKSEYETTPTAVVLSCRLGTKSHQSPAFCGGVACRRVCQVLVLLLLCVAVVVALVAGVLSLAIILTGFVDLCGKCSGGKWEEA